MESGLDHADAWSVIQQGRRHMKYAPPNKRNSPSADAVVRSGARPPAGTALQPTPRVGLSELDTALHPDQRQALFGANGPSGGRGVPHLLGDPGTGVCGHTEQALAALLFLSRDVLRIDRHHMSTRSLVFKILSSGVIVHNRALTTYDARNEKTAQRAVFS